MRSRSSSPASACSGARGSSLNVNARPQVVRQGIRYIELVSTARPVCKVLQTAGHRCAQIFDMGQGNLHLQGAGDDHPVAPLPGAAAGAATGGRRGRTPPEGAG